MIGTIPVVHATGLAKSFGRRTAVANVDLSLGVGDCLALFGPNGAGKTTLLRLLAGLLKPSSGRARVMGVDVRRDAGARAGIGLISHHSMLYSPLTVIENVEFSAKLQGLPDARAAAMTALATMRVKERADTRVRDLSRGLQQRVSIARAMVHGPSVVLLDEPYTGLDDVGAQALTELLRAMLARGSTLILVTHNVPEGLALGTHAAVMTAGRIASIERRPASGFDAPRFLNHYRDLVRLA